jgi:hypothetical protein
MISRDTLADVVTENYRERIANGEVLFNPCDRDVYSFSETPGVYNYGVSVDTGIGRGTGSVMSRIRSVAQQVSPVVDVKHVDSNSLINQARLKALSRVDKPDFQFGEDLAEMRKTVNSLKSAGSDLSDIFTAFRRNVHRAGIKELRGKTALDSLIKSHDAVGRAWLKARYEMRPIVISIGNGMSIYNGALDAMGKGVYGRATGSANDSVSQSYTDTLSNYHTFYVKVNRAETVKATAYVYYRSSIKNTVMRELGLSAKDLLPTAYALIPYSFIVDRFLNFTQLIKAAQNAFDPRIEFLASGVAVQKEVSFDESFIGYTSGPDPLNALTACSGSRQSIYKSKTRNSEPIMNFLHMPSLELKQEWETLVDVYTIFGKKLRWWK